MSARLKQTAKRPAKVTRKKSARDISADGQLEVRGSKIILHEPLASEIAALERATGRTFQQLMNRGLHLVKREVQQKSAILGRQATEAKKPKGQRAKADEEML